MHNLYLSVNQERLLQELPQFFQSWDEALTELIQNAYRARATEITFTADEAANHLIIRDNGVGAPDPQAFLSAGSTGWDESVVQPAGLGFFALLGHAVWISVVSRYREHGVGKGWRFRANEEAFKGAPIWFETSREPGGMSGMDPTGLTIEVQLKPQVRLKQPDAAFRHYYPLEVFWQHAGQEPVLIPPRSLEGPRLETPVGTLIRCRGQGYGLYGSRIETVWEHRVLTRTSAREALRQALCATPEGKLVDSAMDQTRYTWILPQDTAVRPKLPDRREVIDDAAWHEAIQTLAASLIEHFDIPLFLQQVGQLGLPDTFTEGRYGYDSRSPLQALLGGRYYPQRPSLFTQDPDYKLVLEHLGYTRCEGDVYTDLEWESGDEGEDFPVGFEESWTWTKTPLRVTSGARLLTTLGLPATRGEGELVLQVEGFQPIEKWPLGHAARATFLLDGVPIEQPHSPSLVLQFGDPEVEGMEPPTNETFLLLLGTPEAGITTLREGEAIEQILVLAVEQAGDLYTYRDQQNEIQYSLLVQAAITAYTAAVLPHQSRSAQRDLALAEVEQAREAARYQVTALKECIARTLQEYPETTSLLTALSTAATQLDQEIQAYYDQSKVFQPE